MDELRHIGRKVNILSHKIVRRLDRKAANYGVTAIQAKIIGFIYLKSNNVEVFQKDIEEAFDIRRSSVSSVINLMEKNDLIKRVSVKEDGRLKKIILTDKAIELHNSIHSEIQKVESVFTDTMSSEELDNFSEILDRLIKKIAD
ncbi:MarR family transcriptional regulator [Clostridium botulinum]|uniref:MarR family transcriptional regulator n=1 Tax=Clostridium botulinum TaxID=1491 RepID=A0A6B4RVN1_CLOBO|nr:MarR family transcriptional regulator [Clostridium botulinum]EES50087.1 transcriptional regulator, MarR family [Clostridium botulinum E1 str. 'BoNT E Beluga']MBY6761595.1 MarR family transcriptional regulator [Clostridium botulinum]MBY6920073.1 MarR family transcriptional regulator [Clostridium botulinum]MCR1130962.1 MarR family transcriptional regulator [Clostridium botulinum]NFH68458.1 MarR family transcriptional regulator [Clostridium botulinum]